MANPKRVVKAFLPDDTCVAGLTLQPFTVGTILLLEKLNHPLVRDDLKREMTNQEVLTLVYVLTHPVPATNALLHQGPSAFDAAVMDFASTIPVGALRPLGLAIRRHFEAALATATSGGEENSTEKKTTAAGTT